jgi:hypothetical protein
MRMRRIVLSSMDCPAVPPFSTLSHNRHDFRGKKVIELKKCVLIFVQLLSETFFILRRNERDMIQKTYFGLHVKYQFFLPDFNETRIFLH